MGKKFNMAHVTWVKTWKMREQWENAERMKKWGNSGKMGEKGRNGNKNIKGWKMFENGETF